MSDHRINVALSRAASRAEFLDRKNAENQATLSALESQSIQSKMVLFNISERVPIMQELQGTKQKHHILKQSGLELQAKLEESTMIRQRGILLGLSSFTF